MNKALLNKAIADTTGTRSVTGAMQADKEILRSGKDTIVALSAGTVTVMRANKPLPNFPVACTEANTLGTFVSGLRKANPDWVVKILTGARKPPVKYFSDDDLTAWGIGKAEVEAAIKRRQAQDPDFKPARNENGIALAIVYRDDDAEQVIAKAKQATA